MFADGSRWWGWGDPGVRIPLEERPELLAYLEERLQLGGAPGLPVPRIEDVQLPAAELDPESRRALEGALDGAVLDASHEGRVRHAAGKSYVDLVRMRQGRLEAAPDAVVHPTTSRHVERLLSVAADRGLAIVPFGGGTSVVGGVHPARAGKRAVITMDLRAMARLVEVQPSNLSAVVEAGIMGPALEAALEKHGLTLGHFPQSFEFSTLGGWIAARSAGQCSSGYGRIDEMCTALDFVSPGRRFTTAPPVPSATGPSLRELFVGSEGILGVITRATVHVRPIPERRRLTSAFFAAFADGVEAVRELVQEGPKPTMVRLSDPQETELLLAGAPRPHSLIGKLKRDLGLWLVARRAGGQGTGCVTIMDFEGGRAATRAARTQAEKKLKARALLVAGEGPARSWFTERFRHPYLRDELLGRGVMVETLETATTWDRLLELYGGVRGALAGAMEKAGTPGLVLCHLSHTYHHGASLYFTAMARALPGQEIAQWTAVKKAATDEIARQKAALSHHHGVGTDHAPWIRDQHGPDGAHLIAALKRELDPAGVLNPGKILEVKA